MNNNFVNQNSFPGTPLYTSNGVSVPNQQTQMNYNVPLEQSYIENILRLNRGKKVEIYASYPDSDEWRNKVFSGIIEQSGRDHIILSDPKTGLSLMKESFLILNSIQIIEIVFNICYNVFKVMIWLRLLF